MSDPAADLRARWPGGPVEDRDGLLAAYGSPGRGYHDLRHLTEVLDRLAELESTGVPVSREVRAAAWFHDGVYEGAADDEERSAQWASRSLAASGLDAAEVARLVRLTARHRPEDGDVAGAALCDADLAILAADPRRYAEYAAGVRREYAHVGDADFAAGRAAVLADLASAPHLFWTTPARDRWEGAARANLKRELASLRRSQATP